MFINMMLNIFSSSRNKEIQTKSYVISIAAFFQRGLSEMEVRLGASAELLGCVSSDNERCSSRKHAGSPPVWGVGAAAGGPAQGCGAVVDGVVGNSGVWR